MARPKERGNLVEQDPRKRMFKKLMFLFILAALVVAMYVWKWMDEPEKSSPEDMFQTSQTEQKQPDELPKGLDEEKIQAALDNPNASNPSKKQDTKQTKKTTNTEDLEEQYNEKYGEQTVSKAKEQAETGLALYLLQVSDWKKWKGVVTPSFLKNMKSNIQSLKDKQVKRKLENVELFASQRPQKNKMTFGAFATWYVTVNGKTTSKPMQLYYITLEQQDKKWLVSAIITPNQQNMEGNERKEKS